MGMVTVRGRMIPWKKVLWLLWILPILLLASAFAMVWPMDGDETLRLAETQTILQGDVPFFDTLMVVSFPGFWLLLAPITALFPPFALLITARILSLTFFFLSIVSIYFVQRRLDHRISSASFLISVSLLLFIPTLVYKASECRPDAAAGLLLLAGGALFLLSDTYVRRLFGMLFIGCAISLRLEYAVILLPLAIALYFECRQGRFSGKWFLSFGIPAAVVLAVFALIARGKVFALFFELPLLAELAKIGKGSTEGQLDAATTAVFIVIGILGTIGVARRMLRPQIKGEASFSMFVFVSVVLLFTLHSAFGAKFLQNYWILVYLLAPFAGLTVARWLFAGQSEKVRYAAPAWLLIAAIIIVSIGTLAPVRSKYYQEKSLDPKAELINWNIVFDADNPDEKTTTPYEYYKEYSLLRLVRFLRWADGAFGENAIIYSNDFRFLFGRQIPAQVNGKMAALIRVSENAPKSQKGQQLLRILEQRIPTALFMADGKKYSPAEYLVFRKPDILVADDVLKRLAGSNVQLRDMLSTQYRMKNAPGLVVVFVKSDSAK